MDSIELAEFLYMKGHHNVLLNEGMDIEKILLGYNPKPVNTTELFRIAKQEGFVLTNDGVWVHIDKSEDNCKPKMVENGNTCIHRMS